MGPVSTMEATGAEIKNKRFHNSTSDRLSSCQDKEGYNKVASGPINPKDGVLNVSTCVFVCVCEGEGERWVH